MAMPSPHAHSGGPPEHLPEEPLPEGVEASDDDEPGGPHLRRSGEVLIAAADLDETAERLAGEDVQVLEPATGGLPVAVAHVEDVRRAMELIHRVHERRLDAAPNHVFHLAQGFRWRASEPPRPADPPRPSERSAGDPATVAVLDTGAADHPWFAGRARIDISDREEPDEDGDGRLDSNRGHGTFVTGVVLAHAPGATVHVVRVPEIAGVGGLVDDLTLAQTLLSLDEVDVVNLSLGGATRGDVAPPALGAALAGLRERLPDLVVVAAAGNEATDRPSWPAAFKGVVAVAALNRDGEPADFSNRGWWVDAWTSGVDVQSTFLEWSGPLEHPLATSDEHFDGWALWCGTSFAAPAVAGVVAARTPAAGSARRAAFDLLAGGRARGDLHGSILDLPGTT